VGRGGGKSEGDIGENDNKKGGGITFSFLFANWKSSGRVIRVKY